MCRYKEEPIGHRIILNDLEEYGKSFGKVSVERLQFKRICIIKYQKEILIELHNNMDITIYYRHTMFHRWAQVD